MNELASEPRSLYPALKDKEGNKQGGEKNKKEAGWIEEQSEW